MKEWPTITMMFFSWDVWAPFQYIHFLEHLKKYPSWPSRFSGDDQILQNTKASPRGSLSVWEKNWKNHIPFAHTRSVSFPREHYFWAQYQVFCIPSCKLEKVSWCNNIHSKTFRGTPFASSKTHSGWALIDIQSFSALIQIFFSAMFRASLILTSLVITDSVMYISEHLWFSAEHYWQAANKQRPQEQPKKVFFFRYWCWKVEKPKITE